MTGLVAGSDRSRPTLLLPCAGRSSRYPGVRPKWMLTTPTGELALERAVASVEGNAGLRKVVAVRKDHDEAYGATQVVKDVLGTETDVLVIDGDTRGPADTVYRMIEAFGLQGPVAAKDADSFFDAIPCPTHSFIAVSDLRRELDISRVGAKSFVLLNDQGLVDGVAEKDVCANRISSGFYGFSDAEHFAACFESLARDFDGEVFVSHVIGKSLLDGEIYVPIEVSNLIDVGTLSDWRSFVARHATLVVDIDGVVVRNQSRFFPPLWTDPATPLDGNVGYLKSAQASGAQLVFMTARPERLREATETLLEDLGLHPHALIMGCNHARRVLVNDFARSNPHPSAVAVNLPRNGDVLADYLDLN